MHYFCCILLHIIISGHVVVEFGPDNRARNFSTDFSVFIQEFQLMIVEKGELKLDLWQPTRVGKAFVDKVINSVLDLSVTVVNVVSVDFVVRLKRLNLELNVIIWLNEILNRIELRLLVKGLELLEIFWELSLYLMLSH